MDKGPGTKWNNVRWPRLLSDPVHCAVVIFGIDGRGSQRGEVFTKTNTLFVFFWKKRVEIRTKNCFVGRFCLRDEVPSVGGDPM